MEAEKKNFLPLDYNERYNPGFNLTFKTCQGDTKHGGPCPNAPQENEEFCGIHMHQKEDQEANSDEEEHEKDTDEESQSEDEEHEKDTHDESRSEDEEHEKSPDMSKKDSRTKIKLTETVYILVCPDRDGKPDIDLFIDPNNSSTRDDLEKFYLNNGSLFKVNNQYFLKLLVLGENLFFTPVFNRSGMIVNFPYILEKDFQ